MHKNNWFDLPVSIALAGAFIGIGIFMAGNAMSQAPRGTSVIAAAPTQVNAATTATGSIKVTPVSGKDHIKGSTGAKVVLIEYSDLECPFCKQFHATANSVISKFNPKEVAWVYRHFPLDALHSKARKEAEATECAADLGGNDVFWKYVDRLFAITPANNKLEPIELSNIAEYVGLNRSAFDKCLSSGKFAARVEEQYQSGVAAGAKGTPYSLIVTAKGNTVVGGAVLAEKLESQIKETLAK
jgi:protein-disulfide isomerase